MNLEKVKRIFFILSFFITCFLKLRIDALFERKNNQLIGKKLLTISLITKRYSKKHGIDIIMKFKKFCCLAAVLGSFLFSTNIIYAAQIHFIRVNKGDCELIIDDKMNVLIDCGEIDQGIIVANYIKNLGINKIDYFIGTHPHSDHIGGFLNLNKNGIKTKNIIISDVPKRLTNPKNPVYANFLTFANKNNIPIYKAKIGNELNLGKGKLKILGPIRPYYYKNLNDCSIIAKFEIEDFSFLFCGDAQETAEHDLINSGQNLKADVLKLNHHGGHYNYVDNEYSNTNEFLNAVNPKICVATSTKNDVTGEQPNIALLDYLNKKNIKTYTTNPINSKILNTISDGSIVFNTNGKYMQITTKYKNKFFTKNNTKSKQN